MSTPDKPTFRGNLEWFVNTLDDHDAWATLHLFGWRLVAHDDEKELWWKDDDAARNGGWALHRRRQQREETS